MLRRAFARLGLKVPKTSVLDIGSGTGFAIEQWQALGARKIVGIDLSAFSVAQLRREFPKCHFHQIDTGAPLPQSFSQPAAFDCISALDVLYHIVDDDAYRLALRNISRLLRPEGYLLSSDNFLHGLAQRGQHQVSHNLYTLMNWLADAGFHLERRMQQYVLMNYPVDSQNRLLHWWWQMLAYQVSGSSRRSLWIGRILVPLELVLTRLVREGPTSELAICRKSNIRTVRDSDLRNSE